MGGGSMGGENEAVAPQKKSKGNEVGGVADNVRFHVTKNRTEVHFHDDTNKLKVCVPAGEYWNGYEGISSTGGQFQFLDIKNGTLLTIEISEYTNVGDVSPNEVLWDAEITVEKVQLGETINKLNKLVMK
jgi:hypothetical protein